MRHAGFVPHLLRLAVIVVGSLGVAYVVPAPVGAVSPVMVIPVSLVVIGAALAFLMQAERRRRDLRETVAWELNKLRRIYHIAKNLSEANQAFRPWFTELHGYLYQYLTYFGGKTMDAYEASNEDFRRVSYHIYTVPDFSNEREAALYQDLLDTTGEVARARQRIKMIRENGLPPSSWAVMLVAGGVFAAVVWTSLVNTAEFRLAAGLTFAGVLMLLELLRDADLMRAEEAELAQKYVDNISRLELRRHE
jgi:hypothetical protein